MGLFGKVVDYAVSKYRKSENNVAITTVNESADPKTVLNCFSPGIEICPANGEQLVFTRIKGSSSFLVSIGGVNQKIAPDTARGERRIYSVSSDGETIKAIAKFKNDGVLELNGATDSAVLFSQLETAFNTLKTEFNVHTHPTAPSGPISPPSNAPSGADITLAESADVKLS